MTDPPSPLLEVEEVRQWRDWLADQGGAHSGCIWLVYHKAHTGKAGVSYNESVEEALCHGWVDSLVRRIDEDRYARKFTPRKPDSNWSASNRRRVRKLIAAGRMTERGLALVEAAKNSGRWKDHRPPDVDDAIPRELAAGLRKHRVARDFFDALTGNQRLQFITWINAAKRPDTKARRIKESMKLLNRGQKLGMR